jgi:subtilase family serine protease
MKNKSSKIILTVVFAGILVFGASFVRAQTSNEEMIKTLQSLIQVLTQMLNQLLAQRGLPPVASPNSASQVKVISPNGGEVLVQGQNNVIRWSGGSGVVKVALVNPNNNNEIVGWITTTGAPDSMVYWNGTTLGDLNMNINNQVEPGPSSYKILVVSASSIGNYCLNNTPGKESCNYDYSDSSFTLNRNFINTFPDLTITDFNYTPTNPQPGQNIQFTLKVQNIGTAKAGVHSLKVFWGPANSNSSPIYSVNGTLDVGEIAQPSFNWTCPTNSAGPLRITAMVDANNDILESNENNNEKSVDVCCGCTTQTPTNLPDLTITNLRADKTTLNIGESTKIEAQESNIGSVAAGYHKTGIFEDNTETPLNSIEINSILPGYNPYITTYYTCNKAGAHTIQAIADYIHQVSTGQVLESNENNNSQTITINCVNPISALPDLTITSITYDPIYPTIGQNVNFYVNEKNIGNATAGYHYIECFENNISVAKNIIPNELAPNATGQYSFIRNYTNTGTLVIRCKTDADNRVTESNETNNESISSITIASASFLNPLTEKLAQLGNLMQKLSAALVELKR